ncbi:MAG: AI-2E family transporter, partial [bacterium]
MDTSNKINISITPGTIILTISLVLGLILAYVLKDILIIILTSVVIASAVEPAKRWFAKYRVPRVVAVLIVFGLIFGVMFAALYFFLPIFLQELSDLPDFFPKKIDTPASLAPAANTLSLITSNLSPSGSFSISDIISSPSLVSKFLAATSGMFNGLLSFVFIIVISFYLAVQEGGVASFLRIVTPLKYESYIISLWKRTEVKIGGWAQGQLLLGLIIGPLVYLGLALFQIKYALSLALIAAVFELIPVFGPILSAVPAVLIGFNQ